MTPPSNNPQEPIAARDAVHALRLHLLTMPRLLKQTLMLATDIASYALSAFVALWLLAEMPFTLVDATLLAAALVAIAVPVHSLLGLYTSIVRFMGMALLAVGMRATLIVSVGTGLTAWVFSLSPTPIRFGLAQWAFSLILVVGGRFAARMFLKRRNRNREAVVIYGAGEGGAQLAEALFSGDDYFPVAFVDDKSALHGKRIHGLRVYPSNQLVKLVTRTGAAGVLLAIPSASRRRRRQVLERLSEFPVHVQTMPEIRDVISGKARVDEIREVDIKDLLGRDQVPPAMDLLCGSVQGKGVMVTGAGGSIGSELCRQIVQLQPKRLICFEISEPALYAVHRDLSKLVRKRNLTCEIVPLLGNVLDKTRLTEAMRVFDIQTVYHAAAYKHVPIVEQNLFQGIMNNVFGTKHAATAAAAEGVETFVLVSTDKAVKPTSVMGATKRLAELVLQAMQAEQPDTKFCMVRFGNVLESSGSVVPLFREQIRAGGPVTVTHRDIIRYFMTIPEAAQLVIQAASMGDGGDVFLLDMGKPVRIEDLARRMINLMGLTVRDAHTPDGDIEIEYIGLRPAEKLYEELLIGGNASGTAHPRIMRACEDFLTSDVLEGYLGDLQSASDELDYDRARRVLNEVVTEYSPSETLNDLVWVRKTGTTDQPDSQTIIDFPSRDSL